MKNRLFWTLLLCLGATLLYAGNPETPHGFLPNAGQWPQPVQYRLDVQGGRLYLTENGLRYNFLNQDDVNNYHLGLTEHVLDSMAQFENLRMHAVEMQFSNASPLSLEAVGNPLPTRHHFFKGQDPSKWANDLQTVPQLRSEALYPGIDLLLTAQFGTLKYDLICEPGSDPDQIQLEFEGAEEIWLETGELHIKTSVNEFVELRPVAWQELAGEKVEIPCDFVLKDKKVKFSLPGSYDPALPLVIDPQVIFSSWSGAVSENWGAAATEGPNGSLIAVGLSLDPGYPTTTGAFQQSFSGGFQDMVLTEFSPDGSTLLNSTYLGGPTGRDNPLDIKLNSNDEWILLGYTSAPDFPVTAGAYDQTHNGANDIIICRFAPGGRNLLASTYIGGGSADGSFVTNVFDSGERSGIDFDENDNIYVASSSISYNFPRSSNAFQNNALGLFDGVVFRMPPTLDNLDWSTFLGGSVQDAVFDIEVIAENDVWVCGVSSSQNFPTTAGAHQGTHSGNWDGFLARITGPGTNLQLSTLIGTSTYDNALMLTLTPAGDPLVTGQTQHPQFATTTGAIDMFRANQYIREYSQDLSTVQISMKFGAGRGYPDLAPTAFRTDSCGRVFFAGIGGKNSAYLSWLPITQDALRSDTDAKNLYVAAFESDLTRTLFGTFYGGIKSSEHLHARNMHFDEHGVLYHSACTGCNLALLAGAPPSPGVGNQVIQHIRSWNDWPTTPGAWAENSTNWSCHMGVFKLDTKLWEVIAGLDVEPTAVCLGNPITFMDSSDGGHLWDWDYGDGNSGNQDTVTHTYSQPGQYNVRMIVEDVIRCIKLDTAFVDVEVYALPNADAGPDVTVCPDNPQILQGSGGVQYRWWPGTGLNDSTLANPSALPDSVTKYFVEVTDANGCQAIDSTIVRILPLVPNFAWTPLNPFPGEEVKFFDGTLNSVDWSWTLGNGNNSQNENPENVYGEPGTYQVTMIVENNLGCVDSLTQEITVIDGAGIFWPTAFSPNNDGLNDELGPVNLEQRPLTWQVFDRWGNALTPELNTNTSWDGTKDGKPVQEGAYIINAEFERPDGSMDRKTFSVMLVR